jgi:hypothetical protein
VLPALALEILIWTPFSSLLEAVLLAIFGVKFDMAETILSYLPLLRGIGIGAAVAFVIDDLLSSESWIKGKLRKWRGPRAEIDLSYDKSRPMEFAYMAKVKILKNNRRTLLAVRAAKSVHTMDGSVQWEWITPPISLYDERDRSRGETFEREIFFRGKEDHRRIFIAGQEVDIGKYTTMEIYRIDIALNVDGRVETVQKIAEVHAPDRHVTRFIEPQSIPFVIEEPK